MTLTFDFKSQILKSCISGIGEFIDEERKGCESIGCWTHNVILIDMKHKGCGSIESNYFVTLISDLNSELDLQTSNLKK